MSLLVKALMNTSRKPQSRQEILRQQHQQTFVGREDQIITFRRNLELPSESWCFLLNISGQGGVGKSTLLRRFRRLVEEMNFLTAHTDETETNVLEVMARLAENLEQQGSKLSQFYERYKVYKQKKQELEADPEAPQGLSAFLGKSLAKAGFALAKQVPGSSTVTSFLDEDTVVTQASEWASYVAKRIGNKDELRLVQEPLQVLTPIFLQDLCKVAEKKNLALFFDTYERTSKFLDAWLRDILEDRYGSLPINLVLVIAGREELDKSIWSNYESSLSRIPLSPFTEDEAKEYLTRRGITNNQVVDIILQLSGCLPLLVATLAVENPGNPSLVGDPSGTAVERFLKWVDKPEYRQIALDAALPRIFNQDIIAVIAPNNTEELFNWLKRMPFVEEHISGWAYHDIARTLMLRHKRVTSPKSWSDTHKKIAESYDSLLKDLKIKDEDKWLNETWKKYSLNILYHRLCQFQEQYISTALNEFAMLLKTRKERALGLHYAETILQAGKDLESREIQDWGKQLIEGLQSYNKGEFEGIEKLLTILINDSAIATPQKSIAIGLRGEVYRFLNRYDDAIRNLNQAIDIDSNDFYSIADRAETWRLMGKYEQALQDFNRAIELNPQYAWAIAGRGMIYYTLQKTREALQELDKAIEVDPKNLYTIRDRGIIYQDLGDYKKALEDFNRSLEIDPTNTWTLFRRGICHFKLENYNKAHNDFNNLIQLKMVDSDYPTYYFRALSNMALGKEEEARNDLQIAIQLAQVQHENEQTDGHHTLNLALCYLVVGNFEQAKRFYHDGLARGVTEVRIRIAIDDLEDLLTICPYIKEAKLIKDILEKK